MLATLSEIFPGAKAFFTPSFVLAATTAAVLHQLGSPGGWLFTMSLFLTFDFLFSRFPRLQFFHRPFSAPRGIQVSTNTKLYVDEHNKHRKLRSAAALRQSSAVAMPEALLNVHPTAAAREEHPADASKGLRLTMLGTDIYVNSETPTEFENDFFKGRMMFLLNSTPPHPKVSSMLQSKGLPAYTLTPSGPYLLQNMGKNRAFEMKIQGRLKSLPKGELYMGAELDERPKQGLVTQTISKIVMGFAKQMIKSLHYSFGEKRTPLDPLEAEAPHVTFPLYRVMDWFVVTSPNETPPPLGGEIPEAPEDRAERRSGKSPDITWNTEVTYTMCFHSNLVNFQEWAVVNVPGQGSLNLNTFLCNQSPSIVVYDSRSVGGLGSHKARDKQYMFRCIISNDAPGHIARPPGALSMKLSTTRAGSAGGGSPREYLSNGRWSSEGDDEESSESRRTSVASASEDFTGGYFGGRVARWPSTFSPGASPRGSYGPALVPCDEQESDSQGLVKSGDILPLLVGRGDTQGSLQFRGQQEAARTAFLGVGKKGTCAAIRFEGTLPAGIQVVKVGEDANSCRSDYLYAGDIVILQHPETRKFVRIGRTWALGWSSKASISKIHFVIRGIEAGRPLSHWQAFSLSSRKWPNWEMGMARQESGRVGGRALRCINRLRRRNTARYGLLTLVALPWFDPTSDLHVEKTANAISDLEADSNAITISARPRSPSENAPSPEDDDCCDDGVSTGPNIFISDADEAVSDSEPECSEAEKPGREVIRGWRPQTSYSGGGVTHVSRAIGGYSGNMVTSSLKVSVEAWVEFLHRGRRRVQRAFVLAVRGASAAHLHALASKTKSGDDPMASSPRSTRSYAWICLRTRRDLSGVLTAHWESVEVAEAAGSWRSRPRPRVIRHMSTADQSVRLMRYDLSEVQRREEAAFCDGDGGEATPVSLRSHDGGDLSTFVKPGEADFSPQRTPSSNGDRLMSPLTIRWHPPVTGLSHTEASSPVHASAGKIDAAERGPSGEGFEAVRALSGDSEGAGGGLTVPYRMLCQTVSSTGELDTYFLNGSKASDLGVVVSSMGTTSVPILESVVARHLWESHWREEWAVLLPTHLACYPSLSKKPAWMLPLKALHKASAVSDERCPFPGLCCLRLETIGRAHYLCFVSRESRDDWLEEILRLPKDHGTDPPCDLELGQDPREWYVLKTMRWRKSPRLILNARRPGFDLPGTDIVKKEHQPEVTADGNHGSSQHQHQRRRQHQPHPWQLSAEMLRAVYRVNADPENKRLVPFLDLTCKFQCIDLRDLDLSSEEALCFFANLYHLIVRHMLLVLGPPSSTKEWPSIYRRISYEVGGEVFSPHELEHCVLRGKLPRPSLKDFPKRFAPLPPEGDDHYVYSLEKADSRMSLFLNNASESNPPVVVLLTPGMVDEQLNRACQAFVDHTIKTDTKKRQIRVHRAFKLYAKDLHPHATTRDMIRYGLRFAGHGMIREMSSLDVGISQARIRYHPYRFKCHDAMDLVDLAAKSAD